MRGITHIILLALLALSLCTVSACSWMGETVGRAKAGIENSLDNTKDGYDKGYKQGKGSQTETPKAGSPKTGSQNNAPQKAETTANKTAQAQPAQTTSTPEATPATKTQ